MNTYQSSVLIYLINLSVVWTQVPVSTSLAAIAPAGQIVGNSGDVYVCRDQQGITRATVLDYYEAEKIGFPSGYDLDLGVGPQWQDHVRFVFDRLSHVDPIRAERLLERFDQAFSDDLAISDHLLVNHDLPIGDDHGGFPFVPEAGCEIIRTALRQNGPVIPPLQKRFLINRTIFEQMDEVNKAGLILHELLYEEAYHRGHLHSRMARRQNAFISHTIIDHYGADDYHAVMNDHLYLGDHQVIVTIDERLYIVEFLNQMLSFHDAQNLCGGRFFNGDYEHLFYDFSHAPLLKMLNQDNQEWWGHAETVSPGRVQYAVFEMDGDYVIRSSRSADYQARALCLKRPQNRRN